MIDSALIMKPAILLLLAGLCFGAAQDSIDLKAPQISLWPNGAPGSEGVSAQEEWMPSKDGFHRVRNIHNPSLTVFLPAHPNGAAFIVCPGGGHNYLVMDLEGANVAHRLNEMGIAAFVLKSRLAHSQGYDYKVEVHSLQDAQRAIRLVRSRAKEWKLDPAHIGIMGFSAGGELASLAATRFDTGKPDATDPIENQSSRPNIAILAYPGGKPANLTVPKDTPPTFLVVNNDDNLAPTAVDYYSALRKAGVPVELLVFNRGGHGFGMTGRTAEYRALPVATWPDRLHDWLIDVGFITK